MTDKESMHLVVPGTEDWWTDTKSFGDLRERGVLWAINRYIFHPRGFALAYGKDEQGEYFRVFVKGDGATVGFEKDSDDEGKRQFEEWLYYLRADK